MGRMSRSPSPTSPGAPQADPQPEHLISFPGESAFQEGMRVAGLIMLGFMVTGIGLGILISSYQLPWWLAPLLSALVFAGSVEFVLVGLLASAAPLTIIASTTLLMNARHLVYGLSYPLANVRGPLTRLIAVYLLCDEAYALNTGPKSKSYRQGRIMTISVGLWVSWWLGSLLGVWLGASLLGGLKGVNFVLTGLFIILALDAYRQVPDRITASLALAASALAFLLAPHSFLLVSLLTLILLLTLRYFYERRPQAQEVPSEH